jgi:predicted ATP-binding protein involved in virulence
MYNAEYALTVVSDWLVDLHYRVLADQTDESARRVFDLATEVLGKVLRGAKFKEITPNREIMFEDNGVAVTIDQLGDGHRSMTAWIGDLVRRLVDACPDDPLGAQGIVLVDEIDIHLHPAWQRTIVEDVRELFPNLQFIVSSHSPFIAQDMRPEDKIIVFKRQGEESVHSEDVGFVKGWRVDQILTSYLFDLKTTRDISITIAEQEYQQLLDLRATGEFTTRDKKRLKELKAWLREHQSPPGETIEENELYDAAQSLIDILDEHLSR